MFLRPTKRACDGCISRKVKCSGTWPCDTCRSGPKQVNCTYFKPARKRGPKVQRPAGIPSDSMPGSCRVSANTPAETVPRDGSAIERSPDSAYPWGQRIPQTTLTYIVREYQRYSYGVWPVINVDVLLQRLESDNDPSTYCLALALCAATMAQLQLAPLMNGVRKIDSKLLATECLRLREEIEFREHLDARFVLISLFLHVYHAKINKRNSAMLFIQEAISGARLLKLDDDGIVAREWSANEDVITNRDILFTLLWVSERGYAMHLGLKPSYTSPTWLPDRTQTSENAHVQGLLEHARLFAALDGIIIRESDPIGLSINTLMETEAALSTLSLGQGDRAPTRMADYCITKEWMRMIIWQEALSRHLLSSTSYLELLTFRFPVHVGRDLLCSLQGFSKSDLLPLGRDQLLKCFEITNSLADTVLCTSFILAPYQSFHFGPQDLLHALYQKLLPFLEQDQMLKSILHFKTAEALVKAPARTLRLGVNERRFVEERSNDGIDDRLDLADNVGSVISEVPGPSA